MKLKSNFGRGPLPQIADPTIPIKDISHRILLFQALCDFVNCTLNDRHGNLLPEGSSAATRGLPITCLMQCLSACEGKSAERCLWHSNPKNSAEAEVKGAVMLIHQLAAKDKN